MPPKSKASKTRALQDVTNVDAEVPDRATKRTRTSLNEPPQKAVPVPEPIVTARVTRRQSREMAQEANRARVEAEESDKKPNEEVEPKPVDTDAVDLSFNDTSSVVSNGSTQSQRKKHPSRRKLRKADPTQCLDIILPMYSIFYEQEEKFLIDTYMPNQKDINYRMRSILVDWLVEVHYKFRLQHPTLWLCINLMDRYLEKKSLVRNKLQLLGVASLLIACKFEEIYPPEVRDCVYITDNAYTREEVLNMEQSVLHVLDYQLCVPTGYHFLTRYLILINASERLRHLAFYYAERNLQEPIMFSHKPSHLVSAALYAAMFHQSQFTDSAVNRSSSGDFYSDDEEAPTSRVWPDLLIDETGLDEDDLIPIAKLLIKHVSEETVTSSQRRLIAAKKKYLNDKFLNVAELDLPCILSPM